MPYIIQPRLIPDQSSGLVLSGKPRSGAMITMNTHRRYPRHRFPIDIISQCDHDLAMHLVASSHPDVDGGGLDCTRIGIQQERIAGC